MEIVFEGVQPRLQHFGDAGHDLHASVGATISTDGVTVVPTGTRVEIPEGYVGLVCGRSGLAAKSGVFVLNSPGIIDAGYRGEIHVILGKVGEQDFVVEEGMRIAQLLIQPVEYAIQWVRGVLTDSERGVGGLGSTGLGPVVNNGTEE